MTYEHDLFRPSTTQTVERLQPLAVSIMAVKLSELRAVAKLQKRAFRPPLAYGYLTLLILWALPHVRFLIARNGTAIIGCAIGDCQSGQSRVINICVDPDARRQGIASRLLTELESKLPVGDVVLMVEDGNAGAQALYRQCGYLPVGVSTNYYGRGKDGIWMQKSRVKNPAPKIRI